MPSKILKEKLIREGRTDLTDIILQVSKDLSKQIRAYKVAIIIRSYIKYFTLHLKQNYKIKIGDFFHFEVKPPVPWQKGKYIYISKQKLKVQSRFIKRVSKKYVDINKSFDATEQFAIDLYKEKQKQER
jgi:hypothetical protein